MKLIVCLDDQNGILFNGRRQSRDSAVIQRILALTQEQGVCMNAYSAKLFPQGAPGIRICDDLISTGEKNHWIFAENMDITPYVQQIKQLVVFRWNRMYPADLYFPMEILRSKLKLIRTREFSGNSHSRITEETYAL